MRGDPLHAAGDVAAVDHARAVAHGERDVDSLSVRVVEHVDRAAVDANRRVSHMDPVELRARDRDTVDRRALEAVDGDPVLAPDDGNILDRDTVRADDDAAADDCARRADERLAARDDHRPGMDACSEMDDGG